MNRTKTFLLAAAMTASMAVGGVAGAVLLGPLVASAATPTPAATVPAGSGSAAAPRKFTPNEDATHEAGESAEREAQEDAGQVPTVP
jgi:hypothetical protein